MAVLVPDWELRMIQIPYIVTSKRYYKKTSFPRTKRLPRNFSISRYTRLKWGVEGILVSFSQLPFVQRH